MQPNTFTTPAHIAARVGRWPEHGPQGPVTLELYPTLACNLDCQFCDTTERHRPPVDELSTERLLEIVDQGAEMGVARVFVLGGGEPLLRPDTPALLARIKHHGMEGILTTNGTLMGPVLADQLLDTCWDEVHVSIDGPNPAIHDALRGQAGAFARTVRNTCRLAVRRRRSGRTTPRIALHFVLTNRNHRTLTEMIGLAHAVGAERVDFDALIAYRPEQRALELDAEQRAEVPSLARAALQEAERLGIATTLAHFLQPDRLQRGSFVPPIPTEPGLAGAPCLKAWHHLVVQADGKTSPCCVLAGEGGSVATDPLDQVWREDPFLRTVRTSMLAKSPLPRCRECSWNILGHEAAIRAHLPRPDLPGHEGAN
jgi:MoaA/NifB/PqqE/SkfB family radical SAM enzyme